LEQDQTLRRIQDPEGAKQIEEFVKKFSDLKSSPFTMVVYSENSFLVVLLFVFTIFKVLEDISGNCFVENPYIPSNDKGATMKYFPRTSEQDKILGIYEEQSTKGVSGLSDQNPSDVLLDLQSEVFQFGTNCPDCNVPCTTNMKLTSK
jgi:zinc finger protein